MKSWQAILINACVTVVAVLAAVRLFTPQAPEDPAKQLAETLEAQINNLQAELEVIKTAVSEQEKPVLPAKTEIRPAAKDETLPKLNRKLDMIIGKLAMLENRGPPVQRAQTFGHNPPSATIPSQLPAQLPASPLSGKGSAAWMNSLPDDKKREVESILEEHFLQVREKLPPPEPGGRIPDRETLAEAMEESETQLRQQLKSILNEEQYQRFLDSRPDPAIMPPKLPPVRGNP